MVRVFRRPASARRGLSRAAKRITQKHKVIMESITQEKKKLRSVISFEPQAPPGYTFIPAGNPRLSTSCKEICRKNGMRVFAVTTTPHMHTHNLSQHVHRIGYHFPSTVVANACMDLGLYLSSTGKAVAFYDVGSNDGLGRLSPEASQITINTEARDVLRDLFPNIPDSDLNQIIKTAFQKGQKKVGTAVELPLARRAQLAVVAHIRHVYTDYDRLLKTTSFHEARSHVEDPTLAKLVEWRGDDENGKTVLEDVFREVIVISDDEDSDPEGDHPLSAGRDPSVEIVSGNALHGELQTKQVNYASPLRESVQDSSDDDAPSGFRVVPQIPNRDKIDRRGFSRYQAWDRAINRYRKEANEASRGRQRPTDYQKSLYSTGMPSHENIKSAAEQAGFHAMAPRRVSVAPMTDFGQSNLGRSMRDEMATPQPVIERRVSVRGTSVKPPKRTYSQPQRQQTNMSILTFDEPYERCPPVEPPHQRSQGVPYLPKVPLRRVSALRYKKHLFQPGDTADSPIFVSPLNENPIGSESQLGCQFGSPVSFHSRTRLNPQDQALPSIEVSQAPQLETGCSSSDQFNHRAERLSDGMSRRSVTPYRLPQGDIPRRGDANNPRFPAPKKRRVAEYETVRDGFPTFTHFEPVRTIPLRAPKDAFTGDPIPPPGYISTRPWPDQDEIHSRRNNVASVDSLHSTGHQRVPLPNPPFYSTHLTPEPGVSTGQRHINHTYTHHAHNLDPKPIARGPTESHRFSSTNYAIPLNGTFGRASSMDFPTLGTSRICRKKRGYATNGLDANGHPESQVPDVQYKVNDHVPSSNDVPRRGELYAEDFVRPVHDYDPLGLAPYPYIQANRTMEGSANSFRVYGRVRNELPDNITLTSHHSRPLLDSRAGYPAQNNSFVDPRRDKTYHHGRSSPSLTVPGQFERRYQSPVRDTLQGPAGSVEELHVGYDGKARQAPLHSMSGRRAVFIMD